MPPQDDLCDANFVTIFYRHTSELIPSNPGGRAWGTHNDKSIDLVGEGPAVDTRKARTNGSGSINDGNELEDDGAGAVGIHAGIFGVTFSNARKPEHSNAK